MSNTNNLPLGQKVRTNTGYLGKVIAITMHDCVCHRDEAVVVTIEFRGAVGISGQRANWSPSQLTPVYDTDDFGFEWRVHRESGTVQCKRNDGDWGSAGMRAMEWTRDRVALVHSLFQRSTE